MLLADIVNQAVDEGFAGGRILPSVQAAILHDEWPKRDARLVVIHADFRQPILQKPGDFPSEGAQLLLHGGYSRDLVVGEWRWRAGIVRILRREDCRHTMTQQRQGGTGSQASGKQVAGRFIESQVHHDPMATRVKHQIILGFIHPIQRNGVREIRRDSVKIGGDSPAVTGHPASNAETRLLCCGHDTTRGRNINAPARFAENAVRRGQLLPPNSRLGGECRRSTPTFAQQTQRKAQKSYNKSVISISALRFTTGGWAEWLGWGKKAYIFR